MIFKDEWSFLLDFKKKLEDWYLYHDVENKPNQNLNIVTNIEWVNYNSIIKSIESNKHIGKFSDEIIFTITSDDMLINYIVEFKFNYNIDYKYNFFFYKKKRVYNSNLETKISGVFYGRHVDQIKIYDDIFKHKTDFSMLEDVIIYLNKFYLRHKI